MMRVRIGTRGSALAMWQARHVAARLQEAFQDIDIELIVIKTRGDRILDTPLTVIGGKGLFTKEIEDELLAERIDLAVHSLKDLPTELPSGLCIAAITKREDPRDVFVSSGARSLDDLKPGARVGTSSLRRRAFLLNKYPALDIVSIRGNVDTRLRKIGSLNMAGVILAAAGLIRMGYLEKMSFIIDPEVMIPAIGQGALAIEARKSDSKLLERLSFLNDLLTETCVKVERAFLQRMGGGCQVPMAAYCAPRGNGFQFTAAVVHPDGKPMFHEQYVTDSINPDDGSQIADLLIHKGASRILKEVLGRDWRPGS
jgi:hydroxymethylbilane synthase